MTAGAGLNETVFMPETGKEEAPEKLYLKLGRLRRCVEKRLDNQFEVGWFGRGRITFFDRAGFIHEKFCKVPFDDF